MEETKEKKKTKKSENKNLSNNISKYILGIVIILCVIFLIVQVIGKSRINGKMYLNMLEKAKKLENFSITQIEKDEKGQEKNKTYAKYINGSFRYKYDDILEVLDKEKNKWYTFYLEKKEYVEISGDNVNTKKENLLSLLPLFNKMDELKNGKVKLTKGMEKFEGKRRVYLAEKNDGYTLKIFFDNFGNILGTTCLLKKNDYIKQDILLTNVITFNKNKTKKEELLKENVNEYTKTDINRILESYSK